MKLSNSSGRLRPVEIFGKLSITSNFGCLTSLRIASRPILSALRTLSATPLPQNDEMTNFLKTRQRERIASAGHFNFILTTRMSDNYLKNQGRIQQTVNCINPINILITNFSPSQISTNFRKVKKLHEF